MRRPAFSSTDLAQLQRQLSAWRRRQSGRARLPEPLWSAATELARTHGASRVSRALRLDYYRLQRRGAPSGSGPGAPPAFVEVEGAPLGGAGPGEVSVEWVDGTGARMTLRGPSDLASLVALVESFWRRRP
jgi:hypothetical protein